MSKRKNRRKSRDRRNQLARLPNAEPPAIAEAPEENPQVIVGNPVQPPALRTVRQARQVVAQVERYSGMLPHPEHMERFERILPGCTDRMLKLAENQSEHRQHMERKFLNFNGSAEILGVVFGGLTVLAGLTGAVFLAYNDKNVGAVASAILPLGTVAGVFLKTRKKQTEAIESKRKAVEKQTRR